MAQRALTKAASRSAGYSLISYEGGFLHPVISLNRTMVEATKARVAAVSSAALYGGGVFTTLAVYDSKPFLWSKHWQRLAAHAATLALDHTGSTEQSDGDAVSTMHVAT